MHSPRLIIFDDSAGRFGPMTDTRAAFDIATGATNNRGRIETNVGIMAMDLLLEEGIAAQHRETETDALCNKPLRRDKPIVFNARENGGPWKPQTVPGDAAALVVNGRWSGLPLDLALRVRALPPGRAIVQADGRCIAAHLACDEAQAFVDRAFQLDARTPRETLTTNLLYARPWDILAALEPTLRADLDFKRAPQWDRAANPTVACLGDGEIRVAADARVHPMTVLNSEKGPIEIDRAAIVGSFAVIAGPCYIGRHTIVQPHAHIRANTSIGRHCLVAGEISHSIFQGYSNKAHAGYLGNSWVGRWVNLGADTTVSNLKNTYGSVRVQLDKTTPAEDSGQSKLGPLIGDFTRTAIGSRLMTGSCLSTGTMVALSGFAPKFTDRFAFLTDDGEERYEIEKFLAAARKAMLRRDHALSPAEEAKLRELAAR